jgi:hypothetical protein
LSTGKATVVNRVINIAEVFQGRRPFIDELGDLDAPSEGEGFEGMVKDFPVDVIEGRLGPVVRYGFVMFLRLDGCVGVVLSPLW